MEGSTSFQPITVLVHLSFFILGCIAIEAFLVIRERNNSNISRTDSVLEDALQSTRVRFVNRSSLVSMKRVGTIVFGFGCLSSFGLIFDTCLLNYAKSEPGRRFVKFFWDFDAILGASLLYIVVPSGLFHKYIKLKPEYGLRQRFLRFLMFVGTWLTLGLLVGKVMLFETLANRVNKAQGVALLSILYTFGFGLAFVGIMMGFSSIYLAYILYVTQKDASSVKQLEDLISDSKKVLRDLKMLSRDLEFSDDESCNEDMQMDEFYKTSSYYDRAVQFGISHSAEGRDVRTNRSKNLSIFSRFPRLLRIISKITGLQHDHSSDYAAMINDIKSEIKYLQVLKMEKEAVSRVKGKFYLALKYIEAIVSALNCVISSRRALIVLFHRTIGRNSGASDADILACTYHYFMGEDVAAELLHVVSPTPIFDAVLSGINFAFVLNIVASSFGNFLDFGKILLNTKYLQKKKLLSDNSLGLALTCFCILSFPPQFCLLIPFLPKRLKSLSLELLFDGNPRSWAGLRYCFDSSVLFSSIFTLFGVLFLRYSRKITDNVGCNV